MRYRRLPSFHRDLEVLTEEIRQMAQAKYKLFIENPLHPSLRVKKMQGYRNIWEGHVTRGIVFTFHRDTDPETNEETVYFRRIGTHDIYDNP